MQAATKGAEYAPSAPPPKPRPEVREAVRDLLTSSQAFQELPADKQRQIARDTALIADYLAAPEGIPGNTLPGGVGKATARGLEEEGENAGERQTSYTEARRAVSEIGDERFQAGAAREGAEVAGLLMEKVNFPTFVSGLIQGVFQAIVNSSIQQMEQYAAMVATVAKSLEQFRDEYVTENQGRDHIMERFPDMFELGVDEFSDEPGPRLRLRDGVDENQALQRVRSSLQFEEGEIRSMDLSDENTEQALVIAARNQLARQRQQLLASLVLMGINRIVVTDGRIEAKIRFDFQARDARRLQRSAAAYDYAREDGKLARMSDYEGKYDTGGETTFSSERDDDRRSRDWDSNYYAKGEYKYAEKPVMSAMSTATEASEAALQTRAQLSGTVAVNFKSDYLPLESMATPGMIAAIQGHSRPVDPNVVPSVRGGEQARARPVGGEQTTSSQPAA